MTKRQRRYYANNYQIVSDTSWKNFPQIPYDEFYEDAVFNWRIPSSQDCVIRYTNLKTGKVEERTYKNRGSAYKFIENNIKTHEFVVVDHESVHILTPNPPRYNNEETNTRDQTS